MEPIEELSHRCKVLSSAMRQVQEKLSFIGADLDRIADVERSLAARRAKLDEAERMLEEAKLNVVRCEAACRFKYCEDKWGFIEQAWGEIAASYAVLPLLSSCPD